MVLQYLTQKEPMQVAIQSPVAEGVWGVKEQKKASLHLQNTE